MHIKLLTQDNSILELEFTVDEVHELLQIDCIRSAIRDIGDMFLDALALEIEHRLMMLEQDDDFFDEDFYKEYFEDDGDEVVKDDEYYELISFLNESDTEDELEEDEAPCGTDDDGDDIFQETRDSLEDLMLEAGLDKNTIQDILYGFDGTSKF